MAQSGALVTGADTGTIGAIGGDWEQPGPSHGRCGMLGVDSEAPADFSAFT